MARLAILSLLFTILMVNVEATLKPSKNLKFATSAKSIMTNDHSQLDMAVRSSSTTTCTWKCYLKNKLCFSKCKHCCFRGRCRVKKCDEHCYAQGCKRIVDRSCKTRCLKRGMCFRHCRRCCRGSKCIVEKCSGCYDRGCKSNTSKRCRVRCMKRGACFRRCRKCCRGLKCLPRHCTGCFTSGCKRHLPRRCFTKCLKRGRCFLLCRRCCRGFQCTARHCFKNCFSRGCKKNARNSHHAKHSFYSPKTCNCIRTSTYGADCYYFPSQKSSICKRRECYPNFVCVSHKTGIKCVKRIVKEQVVKTGPNRCAIRKIRAVAYAPYSRY